MLDQKDLEMITEIVDRVVGNKVEPIEKRMDTIEQKVDSIEQKVDSMEQKVDSMETRLDKLDTKVGQIDYSVRDVKLTLENETNKQIKIVAEGHAILNRKLDEALKSDNEREILKLRLVHLENEMRQVKERLAVI